MKTKNVMQKIVNNPIARIVLGLLVCVGVFITLWPQSRNGTALLKK